MLIINPSDIVTLTTSSTADIDYYFNYLFLPEYNRYGKINTIGTVPIQPTFLGGTTRDNIQNITISNVHPTDPNTIIVSKKVIFQPATIQSFEIYRATLNSGETVIFNGSTWTLYNSSGVPLSITGPVTWGSITGTLSNQTDLQAALDSKISREEAIVFALVL